MNIDRYVSVDLDEPSIMQIAESWERVSLFGTPMGRVSSGGYGVHIVNRETLPETVHVNEHIRRYCGDDEGRIQGDKKDTQNNNQVLYDSKSVLQAGSWTDSLGELIAEYIENQ